MNGADPMLQGLFPFVCVFLRTTGLFATAPILSAKYIPGQVKVALCLAISYFLYGSVPVARIPTALAEWAVAVAGEAVFGLFMGMIAAMLLAAIEVAGHIVDVEMGFGLANVIDPDSGTSTPLMGTFKYLLITILFMMLNGHHLFIRGLAESFTVLPVGVAGIPAAWGEVAVTSAGRMLLVAMILSCPMWVSMMMTDIALGVVTRTVPQLNVFVVGMPLKVLVGMTVLSGSLGFYGAFTQEISSSVRSILQALLGVIAK